MPEKKVWPEWWNWDLELTPYVFKRMEDRDFSEIDLRRMLEYAVGYKPDVVEGRWIIEARHSRQRWEIILEPDDYNQLLVVVTAYPTMN